MVLRPGRFWVGYIFFLDDPVIYVFAFCFGTPAVLPSFKWMKWLFHAELKCVFCKRHPFYMLAAQTFAENPIISYLKMIINRPILIKPARLSNKLLRLHWQNWKEHITYHTNSPMSPCRLGVIPRSALPLTELNQQSSIAIIRLSYSSAPGHLDCPLFSWKFAL